MKRLCCVLMAMAIVGCASQAWAQRGQGRGFGGGRGMGNNPFGLLRQASVQQELKLNEEQIKKIDEQLEKQREVMAALRDLTPEERQKEMAERTKANQATLGEILKEDQLRRFKQISLQQRGGQALSDPEVAAALSLSSEQQDRVKAIQDGAQTEMRELFQAGAGGGDRAELQKKGQTLRAATGEKLLGVLNEGQQAKWKEMIGEPFKGDLRPQFRAGNRPGANGRRVPRASRSA